MLVDFYAVEAGAETDPGARVGALTDLVVHQARVATQGDAASGGANVGLRIHRVLEIADAVGGVGQRLDHCDAHVGGVGLVPRRH